MPGSRSSASLPTLPRPTRSPLRSRGTTPREPSGPEPPPAWPLPDLLPGNRNRSSLLPVARRLSLQRMLIPAAAQPFDFILHHQRGDLQTQGHPKTMQSLLHLSQHLGTIQSQLHRILRPRRSSLCLSTKLLLIGSLHGGSPFFFPTGDYSGEGNRHFEISTTVGT